MLAPLSISHSRDTIIIFCNNRFPIPEQPDLNITILKLQ